MIICPRILVIMIITRFLSGHIVYLWRLLLHLRSRSAWAQMLLRWPQINNMTSKNHVIALSVFVDLFLTTCIKKCYTIFIDSRMLSQIPIA